MDNNDFFKNKRIVEERRKRNEEKEKNESKERLKKMVRKNAMTIMIAALDEFEKEFGEEWGHGIPEDQLDDQQMEMQAAWESVREQILDRGNAKIRATMDEIDQYTISWERYQYKFISKEKR
jgi:hypothetical protein